MDDVESSRRVGWVWATLAVVAAAQFLVLLDSTVVNVALPTITRSLSFATSEAPWVLDAYTVTFGALLVLGGRLADVAGYRRVFLAGVVLFTVASAACAAAPTAGALVLARAVQGVGAAALSPAALAVLTRTYREHRHRSVALGVWAALGGLGATIGVVAGGVAVFALGWRSAFAINIPVGLVVAGFARRVVPTDDARPRPARAVDVPGAVLATAGCAGLVLATMTVNDHRGLAGVTAPVFAAAAVVLAAFLWRQHRTRYPLIPLGLFASRGLSIATVGQLLLGATQLGTLYLLSVQAQDQLRLSPLAAGLAFLPMGLVAIGAALGAPRLAARYGLASVWALALAAAVGGLVAFAVLDGHGGYLTTMFGPALLVGASLPATSYAGTTLGLRDLDPATAGSAASLLTASFQIGGALGVAVVATAAGASATGTTTAYATAATIPALGLLNLVRLARPTPARPGSRTGR